METVNVFTQNFTELCQEVHSVLLENTEKEGKVLVLHISVVMLRLLLDDF